MIIYGCVLSEAKKPDSKKSKSKIKERLKAVENLVRSELYFAHENIEAGRVERELLKKKLNETLEMLDMTLVYEKIETDRTERANLMITLNATLEQLNETIEIVANKKLKTDKVEKEELVKKLENYLKSLDMLAFNEKIESGKKEREKLWKILNGTLKLFNSSMVDTENITQIQEYIYGKVKGSDLELLTMKIKKNGDTIEQLSEGLIRTKRGITEEKKSRKRDFNELITHLKNIMENQNDIIQNQNTLIENHEKFSNDMINRAEALQTATDTLRTKLDSQEKELSALRKLQIHLSNETQRLILDSCRSPEGIPIETSVSQETDTPKETQAWSVRLVDGRGPYEGRVEVNYQGRHGTVCDDLWGDNDARVVCKMLGYSPTGAEAYSGPANSYGHRFGEGRGEILLSHLECLGDEDSLFSCKHRGIGVHNCNHGDDAGVKCCSSTKK